MHRDSCFQVSSIEGKRSDLEIISFWKIVLGVGICRCFGRYMAAVYMLAELSIFWKNKRGLEDIDDGIEGILLDSPYVN